MLEANDIHLAYGRKPVLDGVSISVAPGAREGLTGPSGTGKSTLARVLALLLAPDQGTVSLGGEVVTRFGVRARPELRRRVQMLWQSPRQATDPRLRLEEIISEPLRAAGRNSSEDTALAADWAGRVGLTPGLLARYPHEVSDGQLQRACLARAMVLEPRYLVCDEIGSMLDVSTQAALLGAISSAQETRDLGVVLITHDLTLARTWCTGSTSLG